MTCRDFATLCLILVGIVAAGCGDDGGPATPEPPVIGATWRLVETGVSNSVEGFASNDSLAILVGDGGIIYSSPDGLIWTERREGGPQDGLYDALWFETRFVAVGMNGTLITSPDGDDWSYIGAEDQAHLYGLAADDSLAVAVGESGSVYVSDDAVTWDLFRQATDLVLTDVVAGLERWVATAERGVILYSTDALNWDSAATGVGSSVDFTAVAATQDGFFALGINRLADPPERCGLYFSVDGVEWDWLSSIDAWYLHDLLATDSILIAVGDGTGFHIGSADGVVFTSTDGDAWTAQPCDAPFSLRAVAAFKGSRLVGGTGGYVLFGEAPDQLEVVSSGAEITGLVWAGDKFLAVTAYGTVMQSADGSSWSEKHSRVSTVFERLAWSPSGFVSLGGFGAPTDIFHSPDGETWERTLVFQDVILKDVCWGNGKYLACGMDGTVFVSSDGQSWDRHYVGDSVTLRAVLWDGSRYLAAATGIVYTSSNGADWAKPAVDPIANEPTIGRLAWNGSVYCAVGMVDEPPAGPQGYAFVSPNAVSWTGAPVGVYADLSDLAWTGTRFVACGHDGTLVSSSNGTTWQTAATQTDQSLRDLAVGSGRAVAGGGRRTVLVSP